MFYNNINANPFANFTDASTAFASWNAKAEQFAGPAKQLSALTLDKFEKLTEAQIYAYRQYTTIGIENAQAALGIHDFASFQNYMEAQKDVVKQIADQFSNDARAFADLSSAYASGIRETSEAAVEEVVETVKSAKKK